MGQMNARPTPPVLTDFFSAEAGDLEDVRQTLDESLARWQAENLACIILTHQLTLAGSHEANYPRWGAILMITYQDWEPDI